ncbi:unnamed protein product [Candida verbasci]|uniref:Chromosome segregation in meiosis protein n=1 Tax=Candida verbasci TaxID=1227364 RepID=A0A9W4X9Z4_9ASCO|nr:unnamed protein product [Candida verbasci]
MSINGDNIIITPNNAQNSDDPINKEDDILGLDKQIKLKPRKKVAKLDNDRIFSQNGLPYIIKNHSKLIRTIQKNDKSFKKEQQRYPNKFTKQHKLDHEYNNLVSILQFYQLWCHGLFPQAAFKDCIHLIRILGSKSPQLRQYRHQLIEQELYKIKVSKGIIDENANVNENNDIFDEDPYEATTNATTQYTTQVDDDDWSWMNAEPITAESVANWQNEKQESNESRESSNGLFVQENDDTETNNNNEDDDDPFDENDFIPYVPPPKDNLEKNEQDDLEMELMREYS